MHNVKGSVPEGLNGNTEQYTSMNQCKGHKPIIVWRHLMSLENYPTSKVL